jgi:hypothetical protein
LSMAASSISHFAAIMISSAEESGGAVWLLLPRGVQEGAGRQLWQKLEARGDKHSSASVRRGVLLADGIDSPPLALTLHIVNIKRNNIVHNMVWILLYII